MPTPNMQRRATTSSCDGLPAIAYASYADGRRAQHATVEELAAAVAAALDARVTDRFHRAVTEAGERHLTDDEMVALLSALTARRERDVR